MILVTGAAGFIGSNFVRYLNGRGIEDILVCDYLTNGRQFKNLDGCRYSGYITPDKVNSGLLKHISTVHHFGAVSSTVEWNGELVLERNYNYTVELISNCVDVGVPISYSSSASVYGNGDGPLNLYAYSKWLVDKWVQENVLSRSGVRVQGWRYFNVWGKGEWHKGGQASPYWQFSQQALDTGEIRVFQGSENYKRDFVPVERVCHVQWMLSTVAESGIWDLGSGIQTSFAAVARDVATEHGAKIVEIPFPEHLKECYQWSTLANMEPVETIAKKWNLAI
jgi:ADP-L-glycero-D-manno-heptose 6-epimerase